MQDFNYTCPKCGNTEREVGEFRGAFFVPLPQANFALNSLPLKKLAVMVDKSYGR
jgi:hypothetical protein